MKTDDLIALLAAGAGPAPAARALAARLIAPASLLGVVLAAASALAVLGPVPMALFALPAWWIKFGYSAAMAAAAGWLLSRLARPAMPLGAPERALLGVMGLLAAAAAVQLTMSERADWRALWLGHSALFFPLAVLVLALPALGLAFFALRRLAPVRPRAAGAAAGLLAGALGAAGYSLTCDELGLAFVLTWYTLGMALAAALGALLGPRLLRW